MAAALVLDKGPCCARRNAQEIPRYVLLRVQVEERDETHTLHFPCEPIPNTKDGRVARVSRHLRYHGPDKVGRLGLGRQVQGALAAGREAQVLQRFCVRSTGETDLSTSWRQG